jgi:hypothetical protein
MKYRGVIRWPLQSEDDTRNNSLISNFQEPIRSFFDLRLNKVPKADWNLVTFEIIELVPTIVLSKVGGTMWTTYRTPPSAKGESILELKAQIVSLENQLKEKNGD